MSKIRIIIIAVVVAVVAAGGYFGYKYFTEAVITIDSPFDAIPDNNAFIIEVKSTARLESFLKADSTFFSSVFDSRTVDSLTNSWETIINEIHSDKKLAPEFEKSRIFISSHFMGLDKFGFLFTIPYSGSFKISTFVEFLKNHGDISQSEYEGYDIYKFISKKGNKLYFTAGRGVFSAAAKRSLIEKVIFAVKSPEPVTSKPEVARLIKISGETDLNIYINYKFFYRFLSRFAPDYRDAVKNIGRIASRAELDAELSDNHLFMTGFSIYSDSADTYLGRIREFAPVDITVFGVLPSNTMLINYTGVSDFNAFYGKISGYFDEQQPVDGQKMEKKYGFAIRENVLSWVNKEAAFCITASDFGESAGHSYAVLAVTDLKEAGQQLAKIAGSAAAVNNSSIDTVFYRSYAISNLGIPFFIPNIFGTVYDNLSRSYYTFVGNYVVFANSQLALRTFIDSYLVGQTFENNDEYSGFSKFLSDKANKFVYMNMRYYDRYFSHFTANSTVDFGRIGFRPGNLGAVAVEFSAGENGTYTSVIINLGSGSDTGDEPVSWQEALDASALGSPYVVTNHTNGAEEVLVFDNANSLYRIDNEGKIAWKIPLLEPPVSDIYMVDFYKNKKYQYVFNTANYIYIVDLNGNRVDEYPFELPAAATGNMTLMDYDKRLNYRMIIPLEDGKLHNYRLDRTETPGWVNPPFSGAYLTPVEHFRLGTKDFLLFADTLGNVVFANRRGEVRMEAKLAFTNNPNTPFFKKGKGTLSRIVTTDLMGRAVEIDADGNVEKYSFAEFSPGHIFLMSDFDMDNNVDYIYYDRNRLSVFSADKKLAFDTLFTGKNIDRIVPVNFVTTDSIRLVLHDVNDNSLFFITASGRVIDKKEFTSSRNFLVKQATKSGFLRLITVNNRVISNFLIK